MKVTNILAGMVVAIATIVAVNGTSVSAANTNTGCKVEGTKLGTWGSTFSVNGDMITSTFKVTGSNCAAPVTLAVWKAPAANGQPLEAQKLFGHKTAYFQPGTHTISTKLPNCFYQADLLQSTSPTAADGGANYMYQNGQFVDGGLKDFKFGGTQKCDEKPVEPPVEPPVEEKPTEKPVVKAVATPEALPVTGPTAIAATFTGVTASAGVAHAIVRRLKRQ
jgi:hypothetical protein